MKTTSNKCRQTLKQNIRDLSKDHIYLPNGEGSFVCALLVGFRDVLGTGEHGLAGATLTSIQRLGQVGRDRRHPVFDVPVYNKKTSNT